MKVMLGLPQNFFDYPFKNGQLYIIVHYRTELFFKLISILGNILQKREGIKSIEIQRLKLLDSIMALTLFWHLFQVIIYIP